MGSSRLQKRIAFRRKLHILRALNTTSKSHVKSSSSANAMNTLLYVYLLKLKLEAVKRECSKLLAIKKDYLNLIMNLHQPKEVKVEKTEEGPFVVRVRCKKEEDTLVSVLEVFEEMGLLVLQARVSCKGCSFSMEATVAAAQSHDRNLNVKDITQAISKAIEKQGQNGMKLEA